MAKNKQKQRIKLKDGQGVIEVVMHTHRCTTATNVYYLVT